MSHLICLSTGLVYKLENDRNKMIEMLKTFEPDGIEINFAQPDFLFDFKISSKNIKYLNSLKFVSIHLPWAGVSYDSNYLTNKIFDKIIALTKKIKIHNLVVHPLEIEDFSIFSNLKLPVSIENEDPKWPSFSLPKDFINIFNENRKLHFNFDFAHAGLVSDKNISDFIKAYRNRIIEIHLSGLSKGNKDHWFLKPHDSASNRSLIKKLKLLKNTNIVLECVARDFEDLKKTNTEIEYIRELLG